METNKIDYLKKWLKVYVIVELFLVFAAFIYTLICIINSNNDPNFLLLFGLAIFMCTQFLLLIIIQFIWTSIQEFVYLNDNDLRAKFSSLERYVQFSGSFLNFKFDQPMDFEDMVNSAKFAYQTILKRHPLVNGYLYLGRILSFVLFFMIIVNFVVLGIFFPLPFYS